ncbi:MAG: hypothetical protein ACREF4_13600 [Gammaproteobacteria bacterium]
MKIPTVRGVIDRRILANFQVEPGALQRVLPAPLRPELVVGVGIGGICLIRLRELRPRLRASQPRHGIGECRPSDHGGPGWRRGRLHPAAGQLLGPERAGRRPSSRGRHHLGRFEVEEWSEHYSQAR